MLLRRSAGNNVKDQTGLTAITAGHTWRNSFYVTQGRWIRRGGVLLAHLCVRQECNGKAAKPATKPQALVKGFWVGRLERDQRNIIFIEAGTLTVRSVSCLPQKATKRSSHGHSGRNAVGTTIRPRSLQCRVVASPGLAHDGPADVNYTAAVRKTLDAAPD